MFIKEKPKWTSLHKRIMDEILDGKKDDENNEIHYNIHKRMS